MDRRMRRAVARAALAAALAATLASTAVAAGYVTTDLTPWDLTETTTTYGAEFHISTGTDGWVAFRWLESPTKITVVSGNACPDWSLIGSAQTIGTSDTAYHSLFQGFAGECFVLRGRTATGQGPMSGKDGRVRR